MIRKKTQVFCKFFITLDKLLTFLPNNRKSIETIAVKHRNVSYNHHYLTFKTCDQPCRDKKRKKK